MIHVMKLSRTAFASGLVLTLGLSGLTGCGSDDDGSGPPAGGTGGGATGGSAGATGGQGGAATGGQGGATGGAGGASGGQGGGAGAPAGCASYCDTIQTNCAGGDMQYPSKAACLKVCALFPPGLANDQSGNSLACRHLPRDCGGIGREAALPPCRTLGCRNLRHGLRGLLQHHAADLQQRVYRDHGLRSQLRLVHRRGCEGLQHQFRFWGFPELPHLSRDGGSFGSSGGTATIHCPHSGVKPTDQCL